MYMLPLIDLPENFQDANIHRLYTHNISAERNPESDLARLDVLLTTRSGLSGKQIDSVCECLNNILGDVTFGIYVEDVACVQNWQEPKVGVE